jgi:hypothetical protein
MLLMMSCSIGQNDHGVKITNIGHGVYYFGCNEGIEAFCIELAKFKTEHKIISISSVGLYNNYVVVCDEN